MAKSALAKFMLILSALGLAATPLSSSLAQVERVDPNDVIGKAPDENELPSKADVQAQAKEKLPSKDEISSLPNKELAGAHTPELSTAGQSTADTNTPNSTTSDSGAAAADPIGDAQRSTTYQQDDVLAAATGVFGKGAKGLASIVQDIFKKQGEPNGYIIGREGGGALVFGLRYGSGTLFHKIEGERPVYWNGPSIGFDAGANAGSTFVLVYNLYDSEDLYRRYPAGEGAAYLIGGFNASYLRRGDVVLIPIRLGVGARLGINAGYMKFRKKRKILPF